MGQRRGRMPVAMTVLIVTLLAVNTLLEVQHKEYMVTLVGPAYVLTEMTAWTCRLIKSHLVSMWQSPIKIMLKGSLMAWTSLEAPKSCPAVFYV